MLPATAPLYGNGFEWAKRPYAHMSPWGISSSGRASVLQTEGGRFESDILHMPIIKFNCNQYECQICNPGAYNATCGEGSECPLCQTIRDRHDRSYSIFNLQQKMKRQQEERQRQEYINQQAPSTSGAKYIQFEDTPIGRQYLEQLRAATPTTIRNYAEQDLITLAGYTKKISNTQEENTANMSYTEDTAVATADQLLAKELAEKLAEAKLAAKRAAMASIGDEPTDTVYVAFEKQFDANGPKYQYAALKILNMWYTSASRAVASTFESWDAMVTWLVQGPFPTSEVTRLYARDEKVESK